MKENHVIHQINRPSTILYCKVIYIPRGDKNYCVPFCHLT